MWRRVGRCGLEKIPLIAVEVFENGYGAVGFVARDFKEFDVSGLHAAVITVEVIGVEEEEDAAAGLVTDVSGLFGSGGLGEEQGGTGGAGRGGDEGPRFGIGEGGGFVDVEAEGLGEEGEGFVVVADEEGDVSDGLRHGWGLSQRKQRTRK